MAQLPPSAQVVVIGAGVMGTSTAHHLATAGADVVLVERETIASGSTSKAAGGFRAQFSDELNIRMAVENIARLERFQVEFDIDIDFKQWGYLFVLGDADMEPFGSAVDLQNSLGVPSKMVTRDEILDIVPGLALDDVAGGSYCPIDGYCTPEAVAQGYAQSAARMGATIVQGCAVHEIMTSGDRITGLRTSHGEISTHEIVLTAGVWSTAIAAPVGLDLPIRAEKRHVWLLDGDDGFAEQLPLVIDFTTSFYFHREGEGLLMGGKEATLEALAPAVMNRAPSMLDLEIRPGWWGYYEISPDHNALVGTAAGIDRLHYASGFSGHGFQQAPVVGEHLAQLVLGQTTTFDLSALDVGRFDDGVLVPERHFV